MNFDVSDLEYHKSAIINVKRIGNEGPDSTTYNSKVNNIDYAAKFLKNRSENFIKYVTLLHSLVHPCIIQFKGFCDSEESILLYELASCSLNQIFDLREKGESPIWFDLPSQFIIIYGIAQALKYLHEKDIIHGRLTPNNILINDKNEPLISDMSLSIILSKPDFSREHLQQYRLMDYTDPDFLKTGKIKASSDIYSFAIITLQILTGSRHIYQQNKNDQISYIIPEEYSDEFQNLLRQCLEQDPLLRPSITTVCEKLYSFITSLTGIPKSTFHSYKNKIELSNGLGVNDIDNENNQIIRLIDNPYMLQQNIDLNRTFQQIEEKINIPEEFVCDENILADYSYVFTRESKKRLQDIFDCLRANVPVLLSGPTGTAKTLTSEIVCRLKFCSIDFIRFNLSAETTTKDLFGRLIGDEKSYAKVRMNYGKYYDAFKNGKILLLDELNLASPSVVQCILESLNTKVLSVEFEGNQLETVQMHPNFRLIATQNPNKGLFKQKRQDLGVKFHSNFVQIHFPEFSIEDLLEIGIGLSKKFHYNNFKVIENIIQFHDEMIKFRKNKNDPQCFTIREIAASIYAISQNKSIYDTIITIYGARFEKKTKDEIKEMLKKYPYLNDEREAFDQNNFPGCFINKSFLSTFKSTLFALENNRNVIIAGEDGCGKTKLALLISQYYNSKANNSINDDSIIYHCTGDIRVADFIGKSIASGNSSEGGALMMWEDGFLTKGVRQGNCLILDRVDEVQALITERINCILDQNYDKSKRFLDLPESSSSTKVPINKNFRLICTSNIDTLSEMSPAFLNRFDIIVMENQIDEEINQNEYENLLTILLNNYYNTLSQSEISKNEDETEADEIDQMFISKSNEGDSDEDLIQAQKQNLPNLVSKIYQNISSIQEKKQRNISFISRICKAIVKLSVFFRKNRRITIDDIINVSINLLQNKPNYKLPNIIQDSLLQSLEENYDDNNENNKKNNEYYFYQDSPELSSFFAQLFAYYIMRQPVCIQGPTGIGKTASAKKFAMKKRGNLSKGNGYLMHNFYSNTEISHFYGTTTLINGEIKFCEGDATICAKEGKIFIADEFNLSGESVMKSFSLLLDPTNSDKIYIPGVGQTISIDPGFFFIACQNKIGTLGRNQVPKTIEKRLVFIDYPVKFDIDKICEKIACAIFPKGQNFDQEREFSQKIGKFMEEFNKLKIEYKWSLRDITKLFRRIYNQENQKYFLGINKYHHVLFYAMSPISNDPEKKILTKIGNIMKEVFILNDNEVDDLVQCYSEQATIEYQNNAVYIMKKNVGISIERIESVDDSVQKNDQYRSILIALPTLWDSIFKVSLSDNREPIMLKGKSSYKTFLSQKFLQQYITISLNQEMNVPNLLGKIRILPNEKAKNFYLEYISKIMQTKINIDDNIEQIVNEKGGTVPKTFQYALQNLMQKLTKINSEEEQTNNFLSKIKLEFYPGEILNCILQRRSLILKNLSNLQNIVFERFNELFSGNQDLSLTEDIQNTFTKSDYKKLTDFSNIFRVFATCPIDANNISEAILSRFTVIYVPPYTNEEEKILLKNISQSIKFDPEDIDKIVDLEKEINEQMKCPFPFPLKKNIIEFTSKMNRKSSLENQSTNIGIILYRVLGGSLNPTERKKIISLINSKGFKIPDIYQNIYESNKYMNKLFLKINERKGTKGIESEMSNLFLESSIAHESLEHISFTPTLNDLLDLIHLGLSINVPIILEGSPGQGKHTAINYIADMLNLEVYSLLISHSTKVEDLFGGKDDLPLFEDEDKHKHNKYSFSQLIDSRFINKCKKKPLIVLESFENSSEALRNAFIPIFCHDTSSLPNRTEILLGDFKIIAIINTQDNIIGKEAFPSSLINSSIYYAVHNPKNAEIKHIILEKFQNSEKLDEEEANHLFNTFKQVRKYLKNEKYSSQPYSLNEINKYISFREKTDVDKQIITQMIFAYQFLSYKMIQKMLHLLHYEQMNFNPAFYIHPNSNKFLIQISKNPSCLLHLSTNTIDKTIHYKVDSLTLPEKHCLVFLACSYLAKRSCIIQGGTASGKSHVVRLFADLLGKKLIVYQMNMDCSLSMLAGSYVLKKDPLTSNTNFLSNEDIADLTKNLKFLNTIDLLQPYFQDINHIQINDSTTWEPSQFMNLLNYVKDNDENLKHNENYNKIQNTIQSIKRKISPFNHFELKPSSFIDAMKNGYFVLIDGIESAPVEIQEKISSLFGDKPEINLYECGQGFFFTRDDSFPQENQIHPDFHLFVTYNPNENNPKINKALLSKASTFTLPQIDESIRNSAQLLFCSLTKQHNNYPNYLSNEIASRFAIVHEACKNKCEKDPDNFVWDYPYNGRTLIFLTKGFDIYRESVLNSLSENIYLPILFGLNCFYSKSFTVEEKMNQFKLELIEKFKQQPPKEILDNLKEINSNIYERNMKVLLTLLDIQKSIKENSEYNYSLSQLIQNLYNSQFGDLTFIKDHILDTIDFIKEKGNNSETMGLNSLIKYGGLISLSSILEKMISIDIRDELFFLELQNEELKYENQILPNLLQLELLQKLIKEGNCFSQESSKLVAVNGYFDIVSTISKIVLHPDKNNVKKLFKIMNKNNIKFVDEVFPYNLWFYQNKYLKEENNENDHNNENDQNNGEIELFMLLYWIPLVKKLFENDLHFSITIDNEKIEFNEHSNTKFDFHLEMNNDNNFSLSDGSYCNINSGTLNHIQNLGQRTNDLIFYHSTNYLLSNPKQYLESQDDQTTKDILKKSVREMKKKIIIYPEENRLLSIKDLFPAGKSSLIGLIWHIVFTHSEQDINNLSQIISPLQKDLLMSTFEMFKSINQNTLNDIIEWTKKASNIDNFISYLTKILLKENIIDDSKETDKLFNDIEKEKQYFENTLPNNDFWSSKKYIDLYNIELEKLNTIKKTNSIIKKLNALSDKLAKIHTNDNFFNLKKQIQDHINSIKNPTEEQFEQINEIVNKFLKIVYSEKQNQMNAMINWPINDMHFIENELTNENVELFKSLIWYSQVKPILNEIIDDKNILPNIMKLNEFQEMKLSIEVMMDSFMSKRLMGEARFSLEEKKSVLYYLEANMIYKLFMINMNRSFIFKPNQISTVINKYADRDACDEAELIWLSQTLLEIPSDFIISMPTFQPNSLFYLIMLPSNQKLIPGPFFIDIPNDPTLFQDIYEKYKEREYGSFRDAAEMIARTTYSSINKMEKIPVQYNEIKQFLLNKTQYTPTQKRIYNIIINILDIAESLDEWNVNKLVFDDISFLKSDWFNDNELINKYPSLFFWICQNYSCAKQIKQLYSNYEPKSNEIPFWLLCLRIFSSKQCIEFMNKSESDISQVINYTTSSKIKQYLENPDTQKNLNWLSILIPNLPTEIYNEEISVIHNFLYRLSKDRTQINQFKICELRKEYVKNAIGEITDSILLNNYSKLFTDDISSDTKIQFLLQPTKYINSNITQNVNNCIKSLSTNDSINDLRNYLINFYSLTNTINELENAINKDESNIKIIIDRMQKGNQQYTIGYPDLMFGDLKANEFIEKMYQFKDSLDLFDSQFFHFIDDDYISISENVFTFVRTIESSISSIKDDLIIQFANGSSAPETTRIVQNELNLYLNNLNDLVVNVINVLDRSLHPILEIIKSNEKIEKLFESDYDVSIPKINENPVNLPDCSNLCNLDSLVSPIFSLSPNQKIECSVKELIYTLPAISPSLYNKPFLINLISLIDHEIRCSITLKDEEKYKSIISFSSSKIITKQELNKQEPIQIFIHPPQIKEREPEFRKIIGELEIESKGIEKYSFPFILELTVLPLKTRIKCNYCLSEVDRTHFKLCCNHVISGDKIVFEVTNCYIINQSIFNFDLLPLCENDVEKPLAEINKTNRTISLTMPQVTKNSRSQFILIIRLSATHEINVYCDFIVTPFLFVFEAYDTRTRAFSSDSCTLYTTEINQKIHFRVLTNENLSEKIIGNLYYNTNSDKIPIESKENLFTKEITQDTKEITIEIKNMKKTISFNLVNPCEFNPYFNHHLINDYIKQYPLFSYSFNDNKWKRINDKAEIDSDVNNCKINCRPYIIISPFKHYLFSNYSTRIVYSKHLNISNNKNIEFIVITKTENLNMLLAKSSIKRKTLKEQNKENVFYPIIGYIKSDENKWFPAFNKYPLIDNYIPLQYNEDNENVLEAKKNIDKMFEHLKCDDVLNCFSSSKVETVYETNFAILMSLLTQKFIVLNIGSIINSFPENLKHEFDDIISEIKPFISQDESISENIRIIISYNLILKFIKVFKKKYDEISSHLLCLELHLTITDISEQIQIIKNEFLTPDPNILNGNTENDIELFKKQKIDLRKMLLELPPQSKQQSFSFIVNENDVSYMSDKLESLDESNINLTLFENQVNDDNQIVSLPLIEVPNIISINSLSSFYSLCSKGASILPTYIRESRSKPNNQTNNQKDSEIYLAKLLDVYNVSTEISTINSSILADQINSFINSFQNCVKRLINSGVSFDKMKLPQSLNNLNTNYDFLIKPNVWLPSLPGHPWKMKNLDLSKKPSHVDLDLKPPSLHICESKNSSDITSSNPNFLNDEHIPQPGHEITTPNLTPLQTINKVTSLKTQTVEYNPDSDDELDYDDIFASSNNSANNKPKPIFKYKLSPNYTTIQVESSAYASIENKIRGIDIIALMKNKLSKLTKNSDLEFSGNSNYVIKNKDELFNSDDSFPIKEIVNESQYIMINLIKGASDSKCPFLDMACNLLIDCSKFISMRSKLYNLMLLIAFSSSLSALEIPYTIELVADENFRVPIKDYNDEISQVIFQKLLDCIKIKRSRVNIADSFNQAIRTMPHEYRTQRSLFLFTDGLDESLKCTKSWKEKILNNPNFSFGIIIAKSDLIDDKILQLWEDFNHDVENSPSKAKLIYYSPEKIDMKLIIDIFTEVLNRPITNNLQSSNDNNINPDFDDNCAQVDEEILTKMQKYIKSEIIDQNENSPCIYRNFHLDYISQAAEIHNIMNNKFYPKEKSKIVLTSIDEKIKDNFDSFISYILSVDKNNKRKMLESIFKPNKPTQMVLSDSGYEIDIPSFLLHSLDPKLCPFIYREMKGGKVKNYGVTFIIDSSKSCFNDLSIFHSFQTIVTLFSAFNQIDIPYIDVIIATDKNPKILCFGKSSKVAFGNNSSLWPSLFSFLYNNPPCSCNLESAINYSCVMNRIRPSDCQNYLYVLTDGLYQQNQKDIIRENIISCTQNGIITFGIGIGLYPKGIDDLFPYAVFSPNPNDIIYGISSFFAERLNIKYSESIECMTLDEIDNRKLIDIFDKLITQAPIFKELFKELSIIKFGIDFYSLISNKETKSRGVEVPALPDNIYVKNFFKGEKILIVMVYDCTLNEKENQRIRKENLFISQEGEKCVQEAVGYFGIDIVVVQNYKDAIKELTKQTNGKCEYYALWILSGLPFKEVKCADGGDPNLVLEFIHCAIQFWNKGGSVILWAESDFLTFHTNLFLEEVTFPGTIQKTKMRVSGRHNGTKNLLPDETGLLNKASTFNRSPQENEKFQRVSICHNIFQIYEGETISYVINDPKIYAPFYPFMCDSDGGISALFYPGDMDPLNPRGDIIIDCGYSKLFDKMTEESTYRYIQNLASYTAQFESKERYKDLGQSEGQYYYRPDAIQFTLDESAEYSKFKKLPRSLKNDGLPTLFAIDVSGSVQNASLYHRTLERIFLDLYRDEDSILIWDSEFKEINKNEMDEIIAKKKGFGGTAPSNIIKGILNNPSIKHPQLVIATDGDVEPNSVDECTRLMAEHNISFEATTLYLIKESGTILESVVAPFKKENKSITNHIRCDDDYNKKEMMEVITKEDLSSIDHIDEINDIEQFNSIYKSLFTAIQAKMRGSLRNEELEGKLTNMKNRLNNTGNLNQEISKNIDELIGMASGNLRFVFSNKNIVAISQK